MNDENTKRLFKDFPLLFPKGKKASKKVSLMKYGFCCEDGWFNLIYKTCEKIQKIVDKKGIKQPTVVQVKEKYGGLRFYMDETVKETFEAGLKAEEESFHICEKCGENGKFIRGHGWVKTLCRKCFIRQEKLKDVSKLK